MAWAPNSYHYSHCDPLVAGFALGHDLTLHCSARLLDLYVVLLFSLYVNGVRFSPVQNQTDVVQLDLGFAYTHSNLNLQSHTKRKDKITSTCIRKMK